MVGGRLAYQEVGFLPPSPLCSNHPRRIVSVRGGILQMRFVLFVFALCVATPAYAHGGGLNHCGCHINHKTGDCHCHRDYGRCDCSCRPPSCGGLKEDTDDEAVQLGKFLSARVQARGGGGQKGTAQSNGSSTHVRSYTKKDGTYVAPHQRSAPNHTKTDNYSTKGNVNPYTGKPGTKDP